MTVRCPSCSRRYRIAEERVGTGATLRCSGCGHLFLGGGPGAPATNAPQAKSGRSASTPSRGLAILADAGRPFRATLQPVLEGMGYSVEPVEDGTAAFKMAVARRPALIVASVHLAGLSGVAICEGVKQSPHLRSIAVTLVGSADTSDLFNPDTARAYGCELFLDEAMSRQEMETHLATIVAEAGGSAGEATGADDFAPVLDTLDPAPAPDSPREEIRRLARIMMSDLRLYNPDRFKAALDEGRLMEVFKVEIARGRDIIDSRFPDLAGRQDQLATALRESIEHERAALARG